MPAAPASLGAAEAAAVDGAAGGGGGGVGAGSARMWCSDSSSSGALTCTKRARRSAVLQSACAPAVLIELEDKNTQNSVDISARQVQLVQWEEEAASAGEQTAAAGEAGARGNGAAAPAIQRSNETKRSIAKRCG